MAVQFHCFTAVLLGGKVVDPFFWGRSFFHMISFCVVLKRTILHAQRSLRRWQELPLTVQFLIVVWISRPDIFRQETISRRNLLPDFHVNMGLEKMHADRRVLAQDAAEQLLPVWLDFDRERRHGQPLRWLSRHVLRGLGKAIPYPRIFGRLAMFVPFHMHGSDHACRLNWRGETPVIFRNCPRILPGRQSR